MRYHTTMRILPLAVFALLLPTSVIAAPRPKASLVGAAKPAKQIAERVWVAPSIASVIEASDVVRATDLRDGTPKWTVAVKASNVWITSNQVVIAKAEPEDEIRFVMLDRGTGKARGGCSIKLAKGVDKVRRDLRGSVTDNGGSIEWETVNATPVPQQGMVDDRILAEAQLRRSQVRSGTVNVTFGAKGCRANQSEAPAAVAVGNVVVISTPASGQVAQFTGDEIDGLTLKLEVGPPPKAPDGSAVMAATTATYLVSRDQSNKERARFMVDLSLPVQPQVP